MKKFYLLLIVVLLSTLSTGQFVENKGQIYDGSGKFRDDVHFVMRIPGESIYFTDNGIVHHFVKSEEGELQKILSKKKENPYSYEEWEKIMYDYSHNKYKGDGFKNKGVQYRIDMTFPGADFSNPIGEEVLLQKNHYYIPNVKEGIRDVSLFNKIRFSNVYPGIDIIFYKESGNLKYDFELEPGADINQISVLYKGHQDIEIDKSGNAIITTLPGEIIEHAPISFQEKNNIDSRFILSGDTLKFQVSSYNKKLPLIIDPALTWSTYFHDGSTNGASSFTRPVFDAAGNMFYASGTSNTGSYPLVNPGGAAYYNITPGTSSTMVITKFNPSKQIVWATFYSSSQYCYLGYSNNTIVMDQNEDIYISGSVSFPVGSPAPAFNLYNPGGGAYYESDIGNSRNFILKFSNAGQRLWATMFNSPSTSGSSGLQISGLAIDNSNRLLVSAETYTPGSWQLIPAVNPGGSHYYRSTSNESRSPTLHRFSSSGVLQWSTYINQGIVNSYNANIGTTVAVDQSNNIFYSSDAGQVFGAGSPTPYTTVNPGGGAYIDGGNTNTNNGRKISVFKFLANGSLNWCTLYGGNSSANSVIWQDIRDMKVLSTGDVILVGRANTTNFPTFNPGGGAYMKTSLSSGSTAVYDGVILKFSNTGVRRWATYIGGNGPSDGTDIWGLDVDASDNFIFAGLSRTTNTFPVLSKAGSYNQATNTGAYAVVLSEFNSAGVQQWGTYFGNQSWLTTGGFGAKGTNGTYLLLGWINTPNTLTTVNPGGGAYFQSAHEASATRTDFIAEFSNCTPETNTTTTTSICEGSSKALTSSGPGSGSWSIVGLASGSIVGSNYNSGSISSNETVTIRYTDGCGTTSDRAFTVYNTPSTPTGFGVSQTTGCSPSYATTLSGSCATGSIRWYTSAAGTGVGLSSSHTVSANQTIYARCYNSAAPTVACQYGPATAGTSVTITTTPATPTGFGVSTTTGCSPSYSTTLSGSCATGSIRWYNSAAGTGPGLSGSHTVSSNQTIYARCYNSSAPAACQYSTATAGTSVTITTAPATPTGFGVSQTTGCSPSYSTTLSGSCATGSIRWYNSAAGTGTGLSSSHTVSSNQTIYARCFNSSFPASCQYSAATAGTSVTITTTPATPTGFGVSSTTGCSPSYSTTLSGTCATGSIRWYNSAAGTGPGLSSSHTVSSNQTIYARCYNSSAPAACQYSTATSGTPVTITTAPTTPTGFGVSATTGCSPSYSTTLSGSCATGSIRWYNSPSGTGAGLASSHTVSSNQTIYARCFNGSFPASCQYSAATAGTSVTITTAPATPTGFGVSATTGCSPSYPTTLSGNCATGNIRWYNSAAGTGAGLASSHTISSNQTIYARCFNSSAPAACQYSTATTGVSATITTAPSTPTGFGVSAITGCSPNYSTTLSGNCATGSIRWYNSASGTGPGLSSSYTVSSNQTIYARCFNGSFPSACQYSSATAGIPVTISTAPATPIGFGVSQTTGCTPNYSTTLSGSCATGSIRWYNSATGTGAGLSSSHTVSSNQTIYARCYNSSNPSGCEYSSATAGTSATITTNPGVANNTTPTTNICELDTLQLIGTPAGGVFSILFPGPNKGTIISGDRYVPSNISSTESIIIRYTIPTTGGCPATTDDITFDVEPSHNMSIISSGFDMCTGDSRTLVGSPLGGTFSIVSGGGFATLVGNTLSANAVGTVQLRYRITNACGNLDALQSINVVTPETATITSSFAAMCIGELRELTGTPLGGSWSIIAGPGYIGLNDTLTANGSGTVQVEYQYISPCGITADTATITINPEPIVTITSSASNMCISTTRTLTGTPGGGTWNLVSGPGSLAGNILTTSGAGVIQLEYTTSSLGCFGTTLQNINVVGSSDATWTSPGILCETGLVDLTSYLPGTSTSGGVWSGSPNISSGGILNTSGIGGTTINVKYKVGTYPCEDSLTLPITISLSPNANWNIPNTICESQQFDLDTLLLGSSTTGGSWSGTGVTGNIFDPYGLTGPITIQYLVSNGTCSDSLSQTVNNILTAPTIPTITLSNDTICDGGSVTITGTGSGSNVIYNIWDSPTGGTYLGQAPLQVSPTVTTTYYMDAVGSNLCSGVGGRTSATIVVDYLAPVNLGGNQAICIGDAINLSAPNNVAYTYLWSNGNTTNTFSSSPVANEIVWVRVTNTIGCIVTDTITVTVNGINPVIANIDSTTVVSGKLDTINVQANDSQTGTITIINSPLNGNATINANRDIEYNSNIDFTGQDVLSYEICDTFCSSTCDTAYVYIKVDHNVFENSDNGNIGSWGVTPNGDGINDVLIIDGLFEYPNNEITIYNRWGDEIYTAKPYNHDWDGQSPIKLVNGTYFFILEIEGEPEPFKGFIHLQK